jgi:integrase
MGSYLEQIETNYKDVNLDLLGGFVGWLRKPSQSVKISSIGAVNSIRSERTVNTVITCIIGFYNYLMCLEEYEKDLSKTLKTQISGRFRTFKPFLHHISRGKPIEKNIIKIKEPKRAVKTLSKGQIQAIHDACRNVRDILLIRVMYEGGLRVGEACRYG